MATAHQPMPHTHLWQIRIHMYICIHINKSQPHQPTPYTYSWKIWICMYTCIHSNDSHSPLPHLLHIPLRNLHTHICMYAYIYIVAASLHASHIWIHLYVYTCAYTYTNTHICTYVWMCMCVYVWMIWQPPQQIIPQPLPRRKRCTFLCEYVCIYAYK